LSKNKRLSVTTFKGIVYVNIREYFEKDGKWLPTKKGVTLNAEGWNILKLLTDDVDEAIK